MFLTAIRANNLCKRERQGLSLLRATPVGKHIEPEVAQDSAIKLIDCFQKMYPLINHLVTTTKSISKKENPLSTAC